MKRSELWLALVFGCVAGLVVGFFLGQWMESDSQAVAAATTSSVQHRDPHQNAGSSSLDHGALPAYLTSVGTPQHREELQKAVVESLRQPRPIDQAHLLAIIHTLPKEDFPEVLEILRKAKTSIHTLTLEQGPLVWVAFWQRFGELDPDAAIAAAMNCNDLNYANRNFLEKHLFTGLARANPSYAASLYLKNEGLPNRAEAAEGLILSWASMDPSSAFKWATEHLTGEALKRATYAATWGAGNAQTEYPDVPRAIALVRSVAKEGRDPAMRSLAEMVSKSAYVSNDNVIAYVKFMREIEPGNRAAEGIAMQKLVSSDPLAAVSFFTQPFGDGAAPAPGQIQSLTKLWAKKDLRAAESWARGQADSPYYAEVVAALADEAGRRGDLEAAKRWAESVPKGQGAR